MLCLLVLGFSALALAAPEPLVYRRNEAPPTNGTLYPGNCEWELEGCYNEPSTGRILQYVNSDKSLTVEKCFQICAAFDYALVEFRSECWCGNTANPAATQFTGEGTGCRLACAGDANQLCGGQSKGLLYKRKPAGGCSTTSPTTTPTGTSTCVTATVTVTNPLTVDNPVTVPTTLTVTGTVTSDTTVYNTVTDYVPATVTETAAPSTVTHTTQVDNPITVTETAAPSTVTQTTQVDKPVTVTETAAPSTITQTTQVDKPITVTETAAPSTITQTTQVDKPITVTETAAPSTITQTTQVDKPITVTETAAPSTVTQTTQVDKPVTVTETSGPFTITTTQVSPTTVIVTENRNAVTITTTLNYPYPTTVIVTKNPSVSTTTTTIRTTISNCGPTSSTTTKKPSPTCTPSSPIQNPSWEQSGVWDYDSDGYNSISDNYSTSSSFAHSGTHVYRARMSKDGHWATASQSITICPSTKYTLKVWTKRPVQSSECVATFYVDGQKVIISSDTSNTGWVAGTGNFDSGDGGKTSVMVKVVCQGNCGNGYNEMFVDDVTITPV